MPHGPAYGYSPDEKPEIHWQNKEGNIIGFWPREWLDYLGEAIIKASSGYIWEVWQPDYRADKIYSRMLNTGVTHRLFPCTEKSYRPGLRLEKGIYSEQMIARINEMHEKKIIVMLYCTYGLRIPFYLEIIKAFSCDRRFPIFVRSGGMFTAPISEIWGIHRPLTYLCLMVEHVRLKRIIKNAQIDMISEQSLSAMKEVKKIYKGKIEKLTMGCDFKFWMPVPSIEEKEAIRRSLNILNSSLVFFASGNYVPRKQLDKLISVFRNISDKSDFVLIIAGHGDEAYTKQLSLLIKPLVDQKRAILHPYVTGKALRSLYWASDIYISVATDEGGPVSVMKAMACGLPVLSTPVGETSDNMKRHNVGEFIPTKDYSKWENAIAKIINGKLPKPIDRSIAEASYSWEHVARNFIGIFNDLEKKYIDG